MMMMPMTMLMMMAIPYIDDYDYHVITQHLTLLATSPIPLVSLVLLPIKMILLLLVKTKMANLIGKPRQYRRPWLGVEVANLYSSNLEFLKHFMMKFPNISTGVVVAEVTEDSPASCSGIRPKDVIVECNGKVVSSKLQFFDVIWDMVGESVEFNILRESTGEKFRLPLIVGDTTRDKFYKWRRPDWISIIKKQNMLTDLQLHETIAN